MTSKLLDLDRNSMAGLTRRSVEVVALAYQCSSLFAQSYNFHVSLVVKNHHLFLFRRSVTTQPLCCEWLTSDSALILAQAALSTPKIPFRMHGLLFKIISPTRSEYFK